MMRISASRARPPRCKLLGSELFPATTAGYAALLAWMRGFGRLPRIGVEGTGAYGAGLVRLLRDECVEVVEVDRPDRKMRRFQGKSDPIDAIAAGRVGAGRATIPEPVWPRRSNDGQTIKKARSTISGSSL
ncbi:MULTISPECIES: transposase [unclassified Nonomuraea]|uniref:IS110 family transposase n=1 Tax=unclassified Nonomuraea TaxID=2593643 RepID=UPI003407C66B